MFTIEILCVGNELLSGITLNTNAHWLAGKIAKAGGTVGRITVVNDDLGAISSAVRESLARKSDLLIITGGLGATYDDMTLEGVARALGRKVVLDGRAVQLLKSSYAKRNLHYKINKVRLKMATIPEGSTPIENAVGSAPSVMIDNIFCLPGVPKEMKVVFDSHIQPIIKERVGRFVSREVNYRVKGVSEAMIAPALSKIVRANPDGMYLKTHPKGYYKKMTPQIRVQLVCKGDDAKKVKERLDKISAQLLREIKRLGGRIA
jgi:molybdenum cofactor synthesis domain-containing protein